MAEGVRESCNILGMELWKSEPKAIEKEIWKWLQNLIREGYLQMSALCFLIIVCKSRCWVREKEWAEWYHKGPGDSSVLESNWSQHWETVLLYWFLELLMYPKIAGSRTNYCTIYQKSNLMVLLAKWELYWFYQCELAELGFVTGFK